MTVTKALDWIRSKLGRLRRSQESGIQDPGSAGTMKLYARLKLMPKRTGKRITLLFRKLGQFIASMPFKEWIFGLRQYRIHLLQAAGALGIASAITVGGNHYIQMNTAEIYHVSMNGQEIGIVSNPQVVEDFKLTKYKQLEHDNPNVHMVLNTDGITIKSEKAFKGKPDDQQVLAKLDGLLTAHSIGVQLKVDGKVVGMFKDKDEAQKVLDQIKAKYLPQKAKDAGTVSILSASSNTEADQSGVEKADFVQKVDLEQVDVQPDQINDPQEVLKKLETGDVQPTKYTVEKGDCVSCIAKKFNISKQVIYQNNPSIVDDMIKVGQVLDLTVLQPTLSVRTVEQVVEDQEVQYDTEYETDDTMRAGVTQVIKPGKNGEKKVTFEVTKVNGLMEDEKMVGEQVIEEPVKELAKKGTKVVLGEGTGKFAWPVLSSSITSGFGYRWGKLHKGVDLVSSNKSIMAADNGKVVYVGYTSDYGNHIIIDHMNGYQTLYAHLSQTSVTVGHIVEKGEKIGTMGATGDATGVHLHFEVQKNGAVENPLKYLNR